MIRGTNMERVWTLLFAGFMTTAMAQTAAGPRGYVRSDGVNAVVYAFDDGHIHELYLLSDGWHVRDLTALAALHQEATAIPMFAPTASVPLCT
jgi:hypothetical protein